MSVVKVKIAPQEAEMDRERVLDLLGKPFEGRYVGGAAEWLKNSLDHAIRTAEPGEPVIVLHVTTPRGPGRKKDWMMECIDFLGTTYEEIDQHLKLWGSEIAASRGREDWAGFGGHGNGGKFHMRQNFHTSEFITYRNGRLTVFGFNEDKRYGFDPRYMGKEASPAEALQVAGLDPDTLPVPEEIKTRLKSSDAKRCRFTVVRGRGFRHAKRWRKRDTFDDELRADPQAKQVLDRARVIYWSDTEIRDPLKPPMISSREGYEEGRWFDVPRELPFEGESLRLTEEPAAGTLTLHVALDPFRRNDPSHVIDIKGRHGIIIASYRVNELPIANRVGADFIYGVLDCPALDDLGLRTNERLKLVTNDFTDAVLEWVAARVDELSDELAAVENRERRERDVEATTLLTNRLNRWKNKFLRAREIFVSVGPGEGAGEGGIGGGGAGGVGVRHQGDGLSGDGQGSGGQGEGGSGSGEEGGGAGEEQRKVPRFPLILVSGMDPDPDTGETFSLHPRQPVVYQRAQDVDRDLWWINAQRPLAERILNEEPAGAESARWRDYVLSRFIEVIQAYEVREHWDGTTDLAEFLWDLLGQIHDSATGELADLLFGVRPDGSRPSEEGEDGEVTQDRTQASGAMGPSFSSLESST